MKYAAAALLWLVAFAAQAPPQAGLREQTSAGQAAFFIRSLDNPRERQEAQSRLLDTPVHPGSVVKPLALIAALEHGIIDYAGEKITNRESLKREVRYLRAGHIWCFKLNRLYARDAAVDGNVARFINHSCRPNCYSQVIGQTIWIRAARNIRRGEELTYDYNTEGAAAIACRCRPGCKVTL